MKVALLFIALISFSFHCYAGMDDVQQALFPDAVRLGATKAHILAERPKLEKAPGLQPKGIVIFMESTGPHDSVGLTYIFVDDILKGIIQATFKSLVA